MTRESVQNMQTKQYITVPFDCKALPDRDDEYFRFEGYLSTYGNIDRVQDIMVKGCFDDSLKKINPELLWQHKWAEVLGIFEKLESDSKGLFVQGKMPREDSLVKGRVIPQMRVGSVRSMSIGYWAQEFDIDNDGIRHITKCMLYEGSLVSQPANELAQITDMKSYNIEDVEQIQTKRDFEKLLRDSGRFSNKSIVYLASRFNEVSPSDSDSTKGIVELVSELKQFSNTVKSMRTK